MRSAVRVTVTSHRIRLPTRRFSSCTPCCTRVLRTSDVQHLVQRRAAHLDLRQNPDAIRADRDSLLLVFSNPDPRS